MTPSLSTRARRLGDYGQAVDDRDEIWTLIDQCNDAWTSGRPSEVAVLYAEDAVLVAPGVADTIIGRDAITDTYIQFVRTATVERFDVTRRSLHSFGDTAVAVYVFEIIYTIGDATHNERGEEILVLRRHESGWKVSWRTQISLEPASD
jgi:uncharacterized protein (TIGR02246 family)